MEITTACEICNKHIRAKGPRLQLADRLGPVIICTAEFSHSYCPIRDIHPRHVCGAQLTAACIRCESHLCCRVVVINGNDIVFSHCSDSSCSNAVFHQTIYSTFKLSSVPVIDSFYVEKYSRCVYADNCESKRSCFHVPCKHSLFTKLNTGPYFKCMMHCDLCLKYENDDLSALIDLPLLFS